MRKTRKPYGLLPDEEKRKSTARSYAHVYRDRGKISRQCCAFCGEGRSEMHHEDYSAPLDVQWICRKCHLDLHYERQKLEIAERFNQIVEKHA